MSLQNRLAKKPTAVPRVMMNDRARREAGQDHFKNKTGRHNCVTPQLLEPPTPR